MNFYPRHIGDYMRDASHLSLLEHGIYARLLDVYYITEEPLADESIARLIGARTDDERRALEAVLNDFFELCDGKWTQTRCQRVITEYRAKAARNREVGKLGGRPRGTHEEPTKNPDGSEKQTDQNPNQEPITNKEIPPSGVRGKASRKCPPDFAITSQMAAWARGEVPGLSLESETAKFKDHTFAASCVDWPGRWRNWMRKAHEQMPRKPADIARMTVPADPRNDYKPDPPMTPEQREAANKARELAVASFKTSRAA